MQIGRRWLLGLLPACAALCADATVRWEHGWKTRNVVATRYVSPLMGYNVGFQFPNHWWQADRVEVVKAIEKFDCVTYDNTSGETFAICKKITDRKSADAELPKMLPVIDRTIRRLR
jgi:hypothetical protein